MSTALSQPTPSSWKEEVNLRLAAHRNRRGSGAVAAPVQAESPNPASSRAAQAAARVAARYAQARSYSDMQAEEVRVAVREAEIATQVALQAQAHAEAKLATLQAATLAEPIPMPELVQSRPAEPLPVISEPVREPFPVSARVEQPVQGAVQPVVQNQNWEVRWEDDLPARQEALQETRATVGQEAFEIPAEDWWAPAEPVAASTTVWEVIEPAQSIPANLIEFPSELVATRRARPRRAEGEHAPGSESQLSIFEVDPETISTTPVAVQEVAIVAAEWPGMELDETPLAEEVLADEPLVESARFAIALQLAHMNRRTLAAVVDGALITGLFLAGILMAGSHVTELPTIRQVEVGAALGWVAVALFYQLFFFCVAHSTPGMKYAGISLCTFDDQYPTRARLMARLAAMIFSLAPLGLGVVWALFDEENLSWHDRISKTYQRKC